MTVTAKPSDADLIKRIAAKDQAAVQALYGRHNVRLFRFLLRFVKNEAIAEELVSETFMEIWRSAGKYEGRSAATSWMFAIGRNKAISLLRKKSELELDETYANLIEDDADTPEVTSQKTDKGALIKQCIDQLSSEHKEVIDLVYYHECSIKEVSDIVGIPENTVKTRMFHARKKLSEYLKEAGVDRGWP